MAKTESTAVNELINLVQTATPLKADPTEDLMFRTPDKKTRMTSTIPAIKASVPPLPRQRAPQGTQRGVPIIDAEKPPVRVSAPARALTVPPLIDDEIGSDVITAIENTPSPAPIEARRPSLPPPRPTGAAPRPSAKPPAVPSPKPTTTSAMPAMPAIPAPRPPLRTEAPPTTPVVAPFEPAFESKVEASPIPAPPPVMPVAAPALPPMVETYPSAAPYLAHAPTDMTSHQPWFDAEAAPAAAVNEIEVDLGTDRVHARATDWKALLPKLIAPTLGLIILGMFVGGYLAFDGQGKKQPQPAAAPVAAKVELKATAPSAVPETAAPADVADESPVAPVATPEPAVVESSPVTPPNLAPHVESKIVDGPPVPGRPTFVDVRIDSKPAGATVTLVDRGKSTFLGTTPISTALDPSRTYDVVFTYTDKPTQIERLDPSATKRLAVVLGKSTRKSTRSSETRSTKVSKAAPVTAPAVVVAEPAPKQVEEPKQVEPNKAVVEAPAGEGMLMISSKPPCEIYIDGVATGLTTPQRAIKLPAGKHRITLVNTAEKIKKTLPITITPDQPTKVIENFMN